MERDGSSGRESGHRAAAAGHFSQQHGGLHPHLLHRQVLAPPTVGLGVSQLVGELSFGITVARVIDIDSRVLEFFIKMNFGHFITVKKIFNILFFMFFVDV